MVAVEGSWEEKMRVAAEARARVGRRSGEGEPFCKFISENGILYIWNDCMELCTKSFC